MKRLFVVTANRYGVLARITSIVSASGANIETAAAYPIAGSGLSIVHLLIEASSAQAERLRRKLARLVDVIEAGTDEHPLVSRFGQEAEPGSPALKGDC